MSDLQFDGGRGCDPRRLQAAADGGRRDSRPGWPCYIIRKATPAMVGKYHRFGMETLCDLLDIETRGDAGLLSREFGEYPNSRQKFSSPRRRMVVRDASTLATLRQIDTKCRCVLQHHFSLKNAESVIACGDSGSTHLPMRV